MGQRGTIMITGHKQKWEHKLPECMEHGKSVKNNVYNFASIHQEESKCPHKSLDYIALDIGKQLTKEA